jgi:hypothetical protein
MGQTRADIAAADQHNALIRLFQTLQFAHDRANMLRGGNKEDFIAGFDNRRTLRANGASWRKIAATRVSICGICSRMVDSAFPTSGPP